MSRCKLCDREIKIEHKAANGKICGECYFKLPSMVQKSIGTLKIRQIKEIPNIIRPATTKSWATIEKTLRLCNSSIIINDWEVKLKNIYKISLAFHPDKYGAGKNQAEGVITIKVETRNPHLIIEEPFVRRIVIYEIRDGEIYYQLPPKLEYIINEIQSSIVSGRNTLLKLKMQVINEQEEKKRKEQEARRKEREEQRKAHKEEQRRKKDSYESYRSGSRPHDSELSNALALMGLSLPFTMKELKKRKRQLIKENHPDVGGSEEKCIEINLAYDILKTYGH